MKGFLALIKEQRIANNKLETQLQQKEKIIKEVREYIENAFATGEEIFKVEILEILDKVGDEK